MFELAIAEDIMRRDLITLRPESDVLASISRMLEANISGAPVVDEDGHYLGVFSEKCSLNAMTSMVNQAGDLDVRLPTAREFMARKLIKLTPDRNVFEAIDHILDRRISGAPVVNEHGRFVGVFSEKTAMRVLMASIHDSVPGSRVEAFLNLDRNRIIEETATLPTVANKFQETPYRRLPVLREEQLMGQISRRDVLRAELKVSSVIAGRMNADKVESVKESDLREKCVGDYFDRDALTINPKSDLLAIAQSFLNSTYRRLPVIDEDKKLVGQISRRDLLAAASKLMKPQREKSQARPLYLSQFETEMPSSMQ